MIQGLDRQLHRPVRAEALHPLLCKARIDLHDAVEASPLLPWSRPTICRQRYVNDVGIDLATAAVVISEPIKCTGAVAVDDHMRLGQQGFKAPPVVRLVQIETRAGLAKRHFGFETVLPPVRRIDPEHAGTEPCKKARCDWPRQNARQIEDSQSVKGLCEGRQTGLRPRTFVPVDQRLVGHGPSLRMCCPI